MIRKTLIAAGVAAAALALGTAGVAPAQTLPANVYLYVASGNPQVKPAEIPTSAGVLSDEAGVTLPKPYGNGTAKYPGWYWSLRPTAVSMGWATLGGKVVQNVVGKGWAPLPNSAGSYYFKCLQYTANPLTSANSIDWLRWTGSAWVGMPAAQQSTYCENQ